MVWDVMGAGWGRSLGSKCKHMGHVECLEYVCWLRSTSWMDQGTKHMTYMNIFSLESILKPLHNMSMVLGSNEQLKQSSYITELMWNELCNWIGFSCIGHTHERCSSSLGIELC
eukprot:5394392-Amphidinium_carterae.1